MQRPSLRQLEYLVALADAGHFGRAAHACAVTQPALSAQILALEGELGVRLFERSRRGVTPTPAGARVLERARAALRTLDQLLETAQASREPLTGPLQLGVIPTVAPYLLPARLPAVRAAFPKLRLYLREDRTEPSLARLREGTLDLLLLALPVEGDDLESLPLLEEPFLLAAPADHPLVSRRRRRVRQEDLAREEVLLLEDGHCLRDQALDVCRQAGAREAEGVRASSLGTLVQMVANGLGVTLLPAMAVETEVARGEGLEVRPFAPPVPRRCIGLVWRRASERRAEFEALAGQLRP
jgi:LysR family hydrogen peroxide-inducible transcriptional activator